jgi:hypothetical protein
MTGWSRHGAVRADSYNRGGREAPTPRIDASVPSEVRFPGRAAPRQDCLSEVGLT